MKVTVEIEQQDYINAITPFRNGCAFSARFEVDGKVKLEPGCYLLVNLVQGADRWLLDRWRENGEAPFEIDVTPETKHELMKVRACGWCGGSLMANVEFSGTPAASSPEGRARLPGYARRTK